MSSGSSQQELKCSCRSPYENKLDELAMIHPHEQQRLRSLGGGHHHVLVDMNETEKQPQFKREQFEFGQCALDWHLDSHEHYHKNNSVALISAGMTTGSDKKYVTDTVQTLNKLGYEVCVFIRRGVGGLKLNSTKFFSPSKWHDFEAAIMSIKKQRPNCRLVAIGFSFGSIELCRYLAMSGQQSLVDSALLISCPFDPEAGGRNMRKRALNRKIDAYLAKNLGKQLYQALSNDNSTIDSRSEHEQTVVEFMEEAAGGNGLQQNKRNQSKVSNKQGTTRRSSESNTVANQQLIHENYNGSIVDLSRLIKIKSLVDFEDNYNRVIQHYPSSHAYGADSRLNEQLAKIKTPTLCLSSEDDFMAPFKLLPIKEIEANENLCMILTKRGGHMAFIDGFLWPRKPYFAQRIIEEYMRLTPKEDSNRTTN
jgi:predicted alpha/beta-fold hydrolase